MMNQRIFKLVVLQIVIISSIYLTACQKNVSTQPTTTVNPNASPVSETNELPPVVENQSQIKFKQENGSEKFSLKLKDDGAKLVGDKEREIARFKVDNGKVKIKNSAEKTLGYIVTESGYWKVENPEQTQELYILRRQNDGDYKLESGDNREVYRIKKRDYGFEIESPDKKSLYKIKLKEGKTTLQDGSGKTVFSTKSQMIPIAIACFGFDVLSLEQQAGLAYAINASGG
ncbi:hypothetical protein [Merismopedia glauca]|uniref:hypothetical protein n=1 Tax=Merismopedia glauca TaxID=292586 RepID=UPI0015E6C7D8|nr:hypothetical protein [Merismopedia glauca]